MHIVNDIQRCHILFGQPVHEVIQAFHNHVKIQHVVGYWILFRTYLHFQFFIHAAVDGIEHGFCQVGTSTKELHVFAHDHWADAAGDSVIIVIEIRPHQIVVFVLNGRRIDRDFGSELFKVQRQLI